MLFLTAEKKEPHCPLPRGGGQTYLGNARLKTFFSVDVFPYAVHFQAGSVWKKFQLIILVLDLPHMHCSWFIVTDTSMLKKVDFYHGEVYLNKYQKC